MSIYDLLIIRNNYIEEITDVEYFNSHVKPKTQVPTNI